MMNKNLILSLVVALCSLWCYADNQQFGSRKEALNALQLARNTLGNPLSDRHNELRYVELLKTIAECPLLTENDKLLPQLLLEEAQKNQVGSVAADIEYITPDDSVHHLSDSQAPAVLIYFNDPDCDACLKVKHRLDTCTMLRQMVAEKQLQIVGIYTIDNEELWRNTPFPSYIINGWNKNQEIANSETYVLPTLPLLYLLDADKKVLIKGEASLNKVLDYLQTESTKQVASPGDTR